MSNHERNPFLRTIMAILSCKTEAQLEVAWKYGQLAKKQFVKTLRKDLATPRQFRKWVYDSTILSNQFGVDMYYIYILKKMEFLKAILNAEQNSTNS